MNFLKNIMLNIQATGPAAVLIIWILSVCMLGIFGNGVIAEKAISLLTLSFGMIGLALAQRT